MFTLQIDLGNDAMQTGEDIAEALRAVAERLGRVTHGHASGAIKDVNGNTVGSWEVR